MSATKPQIQEEQVPFKNEIGQISKREVDKAFVRLFVSQYKIDRSLEKGLIITSPCNYVKNKAF